MRPPLPVARRRDAEELLALYGVGPDTAAALLVAADGHPERLRSEAAWAHLCGVSPLEASSGKVTRHRLDRGGDRQANAALWRIVMVRIAHDPATKAYFERRVKEGRSTPEGHSHFEALRRPRGLPLPSSRLNPRSWVWLIFELSPVRTDFAKTCRPTVRDSHSSKRVAS